MEPQIIKIIRNIHTVSYDNKHYDCKCRGKIRNQKIVPLVGDYCKFDPEKKVIEEILPRKNEFKRPPVANIDQAILVTSMIEPDFSLNLLDRFLLTMELNNIEVIICITKKDITPLETQKHIENTLDYYKNLGYKIVSNQDIDTLKKLLSEKTSVFVGQTGAGKSTLLNKLYPSLSLKVGEISLALGRGKHTTRVVSLFEQDLAKVLDTPGFSALDFETINTEQIRNAFKEFKKFPCPFKDCTHTKEKECAVKKAVLDNKILKTRYDNYIKFIEKR